MEAESTGGPPKAAPRSQSSGNINANVPSSSTAAISSEDSEQLKYEKFMSIHAEAYSMTSQAIQLDSEGTKKDQAFNTYQKALELIDKAVQLAHSGGFSESAVNKVDELVYKMRVRRKDILERVSDLQHPSTNCDSTYLDGPVPPEGHGVSMGTIQTPHVVPQASIRSPPPYSVQDEGTSTVPSSGTSSLGTSQCPQTSVVGPECSNTFIEAQLDDLVNETPALRNAIPLDAEEAFGISQNIQIFFISADDNVSAPSYPSFLRVVILNRGSDNEPRVDGDPPAFLQVGEWVYPLIPRQSPVLRSSNGSYIFPDLRGGVAIQGASVGLVFPPEVTAEQIQTFEDIILQLIGLAEFPKEDEPLPEEPSETHKVATKAPPRPPLPVTITTPEPEPTTTGAKLSTRLAEGAEKVAYGLAYGAEKTSEYLGKGTSYLVGKIEPAQQKPKISPKLRSRVKTAKSISGKAVQLSGYLVNQLGRGTLALGTFVAPYVHKTTTNLYAKTTNSNPEHASKKVDQVFEVTGGAVVGISVMYAGLEHAAKVLAESIATNTVHVVRHKYGHDAGCLVSDAAVTVGNTVVTGYNCKCFGPKAIAKRVAKDAGKAAVTTTVTSSKSQPPQVTKK